MIPGVRLQSPPYRPVETGRIPPRLLSHSPIRQRFGNHTPSDPQPLNLSDVFQQSAFSSLSVAEQLAVLKKQGVNLYQSMLTVGNKSYTGLELLNHIRDTGRNHLFNCLTVPSIGMTTFLNILGLPATIILGAIAGAPGMAVSVTTITALSLTAVIAGTPWDQGVASPNLLTSFKEDKDNPGNRLAVELALDKLADVGLLLRVSIEPESFRATVAFDKCAQYYLITPLGKSLLNQLKDKAFSTASATETESNPLKAKLIEQVRTLMVASHGTGLTGFQLLQKLGASRPGRLKRLISNWVSQKQLNSKVVSLSVGALPEQLKALANAGLVEHSPALLRGKKYDKWRLTKAGQALLTHGDPSRPGQLKPELLRTLLTLESSALKSLQNNLQAEIEAVLELNTTLAQLAQTHSADPGLVERMQQHIQENTTQVLPGYRLQAAKLEALQQEIQAQLANLALQTKRDELDQLRHQVKQGDDELARHATFLKSLEALTAVPIDTSLHSQAQVTEAALSDPALPPLEALRRELEALTEEAPSHQAHSSEELP